MKIPNTTKNARAALFRLGQKAKQPCPNCGNKGIHFSTYKGEGVFTCAKADQTTKQ